MYADDDPMTEPEHPIQYYAYSTQYRFTVRLKWVKSTVSIESRVFGLNLWGGGKYFRMFS